MGRVVSRVKVLVGWVMMSADVWPGCGESEGSFRAGSLSPQSQILQNSIAKGPGLTKGGLGAVGDGGAVGIWMIVILEVVIVCWKISGELRILMSLEGFGWFWKMERYCE